MMNVVIDGVTYVPRAEVPKLTDERLQGALEVITEMLYFNEGHKMRELAYNALNELSPDLAKVAERDVSAAYHHIHGDGLADIPSGGHYIS